MSNEIDWLSLLEKAKESGVPLNRDPIPPARYALKIVKSEATVSQNGNTNYKITAEVQNGPHAGRYIFDNITLSENTVTWFFRKMNALGADEAFFRTSPAPQQVAEKILGVYFEGEVEIEPARGNYEPRNRIQKWFKPSSAAAQAVAPAPQAYSTPAAPVPPQQAAPAPAPAAAPAPAPADPWSQQQPAAPAPAPAPAPAAPAQDPWGAAPAPAPAAPWTGNTPF